MSNEKEKTVKLNEKVYTWTEFLKEKETLSNKPGVKIIEVKPGVYKTKIEG